MALSALTLHCGQLATDAPRVSNQGGAGGQEADENVAGAAGSPSDPEPEPEEPEEPEEPAPEQPEPEPRLVLRPERSVLISDPALLEGLTFERTLFSIAGDSAHDLYLAFARSFVPRESAAEGPGPRCDDEAAAVDGVAPLNGFPVPCPAEAASLLQANENRVWKPLSVTNRFDLAPEGGENCGEQHLSFYLSQVGALVGASLRFSAVITNPSPELGLEGCRPLVDFWAGLSRADHDSPSVRARALEAAFLGPSSSRRGGSTDELGTLADAGFLPFMSAEHFGRRGRVQLVYQGDFGLWHFFEHAFVQEDEGWVLRRPLTQSLPVLSLLSRDPSDNPCASELLGSVEGLLDDDPVNQRLNVGWRCFAGTDVTEGPTLVNGLNGWVPEGPYGPALATLLERELNMHYPRYGLYPSTIAARADFVGTCNGCHYLKGSPFSTPGTLLHVNPQRTEACGSAGGDEQRTCYARSPLLKLDFLPRWASLLQSFWERPGAFPPLAEGASSLNAIDGTQLVQQNP